MEGNQAHLSNGPKPPVSRISETLHDTREQDRFLPVANIARIMKRVLPPNEKIAKDAKEAVQECVSEFICFITSEASDRCQTEKRKTINGDDLVWAIGTLGFDDYVNPLKAYLTKYRQAAKADKSERPGGRTRTPGVESDILVSPQQRSIITKSRYPG